MTNRHISVLAKEVLEAFEGVKLSLFVDGTLGAGGHSEAIFEAHPEINRLIGLDQDPEALQIAAKRLEKWQDKLTLVQTNFSDLENQLENLKIASIDGILLDLGVSSMQLDQPEKGFSFMKDGPLDMRMDPNGDLTAEIIVNTWSEKELGLIFRDLGEEKQWRAAARGIIRSREAAPIKTTRQLVDALHPVLARGAKKGVHPLTLVFQALRISTNRELEVLERVLPAAIKLLRPGGRIAVISFHSLEDRIVKNLLRFFASDKYDTSGIGGMFLDKDPVVKLITRRPLIASDEEIEKNPRSRSAKLRVAEKL